MRQSESTGERKAMQGMGERGSERSRPSGEHYNNPRDRSTHKEGFYSTVLYWPNPIGTIWA